MDAPMNLKRKRMKTRDKGKLVKVLSPFANIEIKQTDDGSEVLEISGYASTKEIDRHGDIILAEAWNEKALASYLQNPIILAYHDHSRPIGKMIDYKVNKKGLKITARISKAAGEIYELIKDGILTAFSVGFILKDADYDSDKDLFVIKEVELLETSVVAVPANAGSLFSIRKQFNSEEFDKTYVSKEKLMTEKVKEQGSEKKEGATPDLSYILPEIKKSVLEQLKADEEARRKAEEDSARRVQEIEATAKTAAERLVEDATKALLEKQENLEGVLKEMRDALKEKADEVEALQRRNRQNKMKFTDDSDDGVDQLTKDTLVMLRRGFRKPVESTKYFQDFKTKSGREHWDSGTLDGWEEEFTARVWNDIRSMLVVEDKFTTLPMNTPTMHMPINPSPDSNPAQWIPTSAFRSTNGASTGAAVDHELLDRTMTAHKLVTKEYLGDEEEEDTIIPLMPIIRDAMARRFAYSSDLAVLRGPGTTTPYNPITGLTGLGSGTTNVTVTGGAAWGANLTEDSFVDMRRNLRLWGLNASRLILFVSHDCYYEMMKFDNFKTVDKLGPLATILTGEVGKLFGMSVVVSQAFDNTAIAAGTTGATVATLVNVDNFVKGELRTLRAESGREIEDQRNIFVLSRRFGFIDVFVGHGTVNLNIAT